MSSVTNVIFSTLLDENEVNDFIKILDELVEQNFPRKINSFLHIQNNNVGGTKCLESDLFIGAFNYLDCDFFKSFVKSLPEKFTSIDYDSFQIMILKEHSSKWQIFDFEKIDDLNYL